MRGIGYTLINLINHLPESARKNHSFVFYTLPSEYVTFKEPLSLLNLEGMNYEVRTMKPRRHFSRPLPGKLNMINSMLNSLVEIKDLCMGDSRISDVSGLDAYLQTDQNQPFPHKSKLKKILVVYDIIPYVLEWDYLWSYTTARSVHGYSRRASFRRHVRRALYAYKLGLNIRFASTVLAISEVTKRDFDAAFPRYAKKITVTPLGIPDNNLVETDKRIFTKYRKTSWGYVPTPFEFKTGWPFVLFVGGADKRRKLQDLVASFNQLRAQGVKLNLVLAGDSMQGPGHIATEEIQDALQSSSYLEDIIFMGFIDDQTRDWLYQNALAFVFPSRYEGFGLPVLEAMRYGCPVISYRNEATIEVAGAAPIYADNIGELQSAILTLLNDPSKKTEASKKGLLQVKTYNWKNTSEKIIAAIEK
jgi:glycosyltransferase involved in cell wall biosynthesis